MKPFYQDGICLFVSNISNNSAHFILFYFTFAKVQNNWEWRVENGKKTYFCHWKKL